MIHKTSGKLQIVLVAMASYSFRRPSGNREMQKLAEVDALSCRCSPRNVTPTSREQMGSSDWQLRRCACRKSSVEPSVVKMDLSR